MFSKSNMTRLLYFIRFSMLWVVVNLLVGQTVDIHAADSSWQARYWNNKTLSGDPVFVRQENSINYDWGDGRPDALIERDNFSVRWQRTINFSSGTYRFTATMDDGMRVWVDNSLIIDSWWDSQVHSMSHDIYLNGGDHQIRVDYYDAGGKAVAKLDWVAIGGSPGAFNNWRGEYFNNTSLSGQPVLVRDDGDINFNWGTGSPAWNIVPSDQFSVRWTRNLNFSQGRYRFTAVSDDGVRLWVNGQMLINKWSDSNAGTYSADIDLPNGLSSIQMEYYENMGGAVAQLSWVKLTGGDSIINWRGEYFNNKTLSGNPVLIRDDSQVSFNWGNRSPGTGVNSDGFSVRWSRSLNFASGRYRFTAISDDGVRVWVNNQLIIDGWSDHPPTPYSGDIDLPSGLIPVRVEYYDSSGGAEILLTWTVMGSAPVPQPQPQPVPAPSTDTGTVISDRLNVRTGPGINYDVVYILHRGETVKLTGHRSEDANWVRVNLNGTNAWVSGRPDYLHTAAHIPSMPIWKEAGQNPAPTQNITATVVRVSFLNLRTGPGITHSIIQTLPTGTKVTLLGRNSSSTWTRVQLADGSKGWVNARYLNSATPVSTLPLSN